MGRSSFVPVYPAIKAVMRGQDKIKSDEKRRLDKISAPTSKYSNVKSARPMTSTIAHAFDFLSCIPGALSGLASKPFFS